MSPTSSPVSPHACTLSDDHTLLTDLQTLLSSPLPGTSSLTTSCGTSLPLPSQIACARSTYFHAQLSSRWRHLPITLSANITETQDMLEYLITGTFTLNKHDSPKHSLRLLSLAHVLLLDELEDVIFRHLTNDPLSPQLLALVLAVDASDIPCLPTRMHMRLAQLTASHLRQLCSLAPTTPSAARAILGALLYGPQIETGMFPFLVTFLQRAIHGQSLESVFVDVPERLSVLLNCQAIDIHNSIERLQPGRKILLERYRTLALESIPSGKKRATRRVILESEHPLPRDLPREVRRVRVPDANEAVCVRVDIRSRLWTGERLRIFANGRSGGPEWGRPAYVGFGHRFPKECTYVKGRDFWVAFDRDWESDIEADMEDELQHDPWGWRLIAEAADGANARSVRVVRETRATTASSILGVRKLRL